MSVEQNRKAYKKYYNTRRVVLIAQRQKFISDLKLNLGCSICGYNKCARALHFHHKENKDEGIARMCRTSGLQSIKSEIEKCILVCANCHAEIHDAIK